MNAKKFRKIAKFHYKGEHYQMFYDSMNRAAFLLIDDFGNYHYPELERVIEINFYLHHRKDVLNIKNDQIKKFRFLPKVKYAGVITLLTASILSGCGRNDSVLPSHGAPNRYESSTSIEVSEYVDEIDENIENVIDDSLTDDDINQKYLDLLAPADDDIDYRYASDYNYLKFTNRYQVRDASAYETIFGYSNVTVAQIQEALNKNNNISQKYKDFILQYVKDWLTLWPESDFSNLYHNLFTLQIHEISRNDMTMNALSSNVAAQYIKSENAIYVLNDLDLSRESDDYIILAHELTHAARTAKYEEDGRKVSIDFYENHNMGEFADEAIITDLVYQMQGLGNRSNKYTLQSSYYRIILDCIGYDGNDYMNHSVNYLIDKMDEYMGDEQYAYHIVSLIDAEGSLHYTDYMQVDFHEFSELYDYITRMYCKKHLYSNLSSDEVRGVYDNLIYEITYFFDQMANPYDLDMEVFENTFKKCASELGLSFGYTR